MSVVWPWIAIVIGLGMLGFTALYAAREQQKFRMLKARLRTFR